VTDRYHSCYLGPAGVRVTALLKGRNRGGCLSSMPEQNTYYVHRARTAINRAGRLVGLGKGAKVLAPSYNCGSEVDALFALGADVELYRIDRRGTIDTGDLVARIDSRTKAVYVTHYFGFPQAIEEIARVCEERAIFLIEDCALSMLSSVGGRRLGTFGDVGIFSFPKLLPVPDGGALVVNTTRVGVGRWRLRGAPLGSVFSSLLPLLKFRTLEASSRCPIALYLTKCILAWLARRATPPRLTVARRGIPASYYYDRRLTDRSISDFSRRLIGTYDASALVEIRRRNYLEYLRMLGGNRATAPLYDGLPEGVCPLCFPVLISKRAQVCDKLANLSINAISWWSGYHPRFDWEQYPDSCYLKDHVLALPVDEHKTAKQIAYICRQIVEATS
jgi:perosamine synthetase